MKYKIWLYVEEYDEETDHYEDVFEPESIGGEFDTLLKAISFKNQLVNIVYIPENCECDDTHEKNRTVCRFCHDKGLTIESAWWRNKK